MKKNKFKKWKPGQLVTLDNHIYRVTKTKTNSLVNCRYNCDYFRECNRLNFNCVPRMGFVNYLKLVK